MTRWAFQQLQYTPFVKWIDNKMSAVLSDLFRDVNTKPGTQSRVGTEHTLGFQSYDHADKKLIHQVDLHANTHTHLWTIFLPHTSSLCSCPSKHVQKVLTAVQGITAACSRFVISTHKRTHSYFSMSTTASIIPDTRLLTQGLWGGRKGGVWKIP